MSAATTAGAPEKPAIMFLALMLPYFVVLSVAWTIFFLAWFALGIPWGL